METLRRFRLMAVRLSLMVIGLAAAVGAAFEGTIAVGILLGGLGGVLAFWLVATRVEKLAMLSPKQVKFAAYGWTGVRLTIYALVLYKAFTLDPEHLHGLIPAVCGLFVTPIVCALLGLTGLDLKDKES